MFNFYHKQRGGYTHNLQNWLIPVASFKHNAADSTYALTHRALILDVEIFKVNLQGLAEHNKC